MESSIIIEGEINAAQFWCIKVDLKCLHGATSVQDGTASHGEGMMSPNAIFHSRTLSGDFQRSLGLWGRQDNVDYTNNRYNPLFCVGVSN